MKVDEPFKVIGELRPLQRESARKSIAFEAVGTSDVRSAGNSSPKACRFLTKPATLRPPKPMP